MLKEFEEHLESIIKLVDQCPEDLRVPCFEILTKAIVESLSSAPGRDGLRSVLSAATQGAGGSLFVKQHELTEDVLSRVYHQDGDSYQIIVKDLKARSVAEKQRRLALLLGAIGAIHGVESVIEHETLGQLCRNYAADDPSNLSGNIRTQRDAFLRKGNGWVLTVPGLERAAELIKELSG